MDALFSLLTIIPILFAISYIAIIVGIILIIIKIVRAFMAIAESQKAIAESQQEISLKLGKLNAILANRQTTGNNAQSHRDTGAGAGQPSEPTTPPEQNH